MLVLVLELGRLTEGQSSRLDFQNILRKRHLMFRHHWLNISIQSPRLVFPVIVALIVGPTANAAFTAAILVVGVVQMIPNLLSTVLFALAPGDEESLRREVRRTMRISLVLSIVSASCFFIFSHLIWFVRSQLRDGQHGHGNPRIEYIPVRHQIPLRGHRPEFREICNKQCSEPCRRHLGSWACGSRWRATRSDRRGDRYFFALGWRSRLRAHGVRSASIPSEIGKRGPGTGKDRGEVGERKAKPVTHERRSDKWPTNRQADRTVDLHLFGQ